MSGLPATEPFVVVADAENHTSRRIIVSSFYNQSSVYLLRQNKTTGDTIFSIQDYTGDYPQSSTALLVQRGINGSWETVAGDYFGATGEFPAQLRYQARHRLVLTNLDTGDRRVVGAYTPLTSSTQTVRVTTQGEIDVAGVGINIGIGPSTRTLTNTSDEKITVSVDKNTGNTVEGYVKIIYNSPNQSSQTVLVNKSFSGTGEYQYLLDLQNRESGTITVEVSYLTLQIASTETASFSIRRAFGSENSLLAVLASVEPRFPAGHVDAFQSVVVLITTVIAATATASEIRASTEVVGGVAVIVLAGWAVIGWIGYGIVFVAGTTYVSFGAIRRGL